jgi:hypothetical protein
LLEVMKPQAPPPAAKAPPPAAAPAAKAPAAKSPVAKPAPAKAPARQPVKPVAQEKKKGKGCGASVLVFALGASAFFYWLLT